MKLTGKLCTLQPWQDTTPEAITAQANNPNVRRYLRRSFPSPYTIEDAKSWLKMNEDLDPIPRFAIMVDGAFAGGIGLEFKTDVYACNAELGYWLGEDFWGKGIMTDAIPLIVEYAFKSFPITRIFAGVNEANVGSMRALEKAGFELEAIAKKGLITDGLISDQYIYSTIKPD